MATNKQRDIMDDLLKGTSEDLPEGLGMLGSMIRRKAEKKPDARNGQSPNSALSGGKPGPGAKKKTTHYLSGEICENLDEAKEKINTLMQGRQKARVSKSGIVNQALKMILKDFAEKGEKSPLIQEILKSADKG